MLTNWRDCLAYDVRCVYGYTVVKGQGQVVDFLDLLNTIYPFTDRGSKFDSIAGWLSDAKAIGIITFGEYHDCLTALANNI